MFILVAGLWEADQVVDNQGVGDNSDSGSCREVIVSDNGQCPQNSYNFSHSFKYLMCNFCVKVWGNTKSVGGTGHAGVPETQEQRDKSQGLIKVGIFITFNAILIHRVRINCSEDSSHRKCCCVLGHTSWRQWGLLCCCLGLLVVLNF